MASKLEEQFAALWEYHFPDIDLHSEVCLIPGRKFRFDFVHHPSKTAIEINGGNWIRGRHSRPLGLQNEYEKILLAALQGYQTIPLSGEQIDEEHLGKVANLIKLRQTQN